MPDPSPHQPGGAPDKIAIDYLKSNSFRVVHADGVVGGITPRGLIHMNFYSERQAIPRRMVYAITPEQRLGDEIMEERVVRDGVVREIEVAAVMDLNVAKEFHKWLDGKIKFLEPPK